MFKQLKPRRFNRLEVQSYEFAGGYDLKQPLTQMGLDRIFSQEDPDLSGISRQKTCVDFTMHKTYIRSDEEGAEGAAATASRVFSDNTAPPELEFVADRPHLQAIVHQLTGAILALVRIEDPR